MSIDLIAILYLIAEQWLFKVCLCFSEHIMDSHSLIVYLLCLTCLTVLQVILSQLRSSLKLRTLIMRVVNIGVWFLCSPILLMHLNLA